MRSKTSFWKRSLAAFLSFVMLLGMMPVLGGGNVAVEAEAAQVEGNYITMPITIRDFAADGMLFEFNQAGATGTTGVSETSTFSINGFNPSYSTWITGYKVDTGIYVCTYAGLTQTGPWGAGRDHLMVICNSDGSIQEVLPYGASKGTYSSTKDKMTSTDYVIWVGNAGSAYSALSAITSATMSSYTLTYSGSTLTVKLTGTGTVYNQGDTAGFSMLATGNADYIKNLPADESQTIAGTDLIMNGSWGLATDPDPVTATLNSGATQQVYGAWIRTDLVQAELDDNGKMVYTEAAVDYLADYMQQIMAVEWQNSDGSYNTYFVTGVELDELGGETLAAKIRTQVTGGLGTYAAAKAKYEAGNLNVYTGIETWYDAAYFLLHNTFNDSTGYGKTASQYNSLHLVESTNSDGETCYVFNSGYDDAVYDATNGEIYNTQTETITIAKTNSGTESYVRGNALPDARFDPLGMSGAGADLGYGMSGDTYGDMVSDNTSDWADYYDNTNYNLTLEGHAQFIYYEDSNLYFTFTGDDDVYLYINGVRVLDVGAAHSISKVKISLNDVAELCGLRDGQAYDFDFFYMERHGTAANFGIETNIKIVDPSMTTNKTGYQNGSSTGYNGFVDPNKSVGYSFELQNNGEADIQNLTFTDDDIGVYFGYDSVKLNSDSDINEMYLYHWNADGTIKESYAAGSLTEDIIKTKLTAGLAVGEKIGIYGFRYLIPEDSWVDGVFPNTVYTTAISIGDNNSTQTLNGMADWKVQKSTLVADPFHVYDWVAKNVSNDPEDNTDWYSPAEASVTVTKAELTAPVPDTITVPSDVEIVLCSASGNEGGVNINANATLNDDGSITYTSTQPGLDTVYYKIKGMGYDTVVFHYDVYTYGTVNNVYVLDYGLSVELNGEDFGFQVNDYLSMSQNPNATTATVTGIQDATSAYGDFTWEDPSLKYTPDAIINDIDTVRANVQVLEDGATELTKFTGVAMYETITTAPANVVYYEENFPGITYVNEGENEWAHYETVDEDGNSVAGTEQSADQDSNYGSDPNYEEDKVGSLESGENVGTVIDRTTFNLDTSDLNALQASGIEALNNYLGLGGSDSNGTVNELVVNTTAEVMYFEFVGTGFEIISRTTDEMYAVINVQVWAKDDNGEYTICKTQKPVITESKGGDLYQVPIISITGLTRDEYRVTVKAAASTATKTRVLYIDGIRIYGPLSDDQALEYYNPEEYYAEFFEVKELIDNGQMIYADASETDDDLELVTGTTLVEDTSGGGVLTSIEDVTEYMSIGPNNELYLEGNSATGMIAFFLTPVENYPDAARTLEIGAHRKSDSGSDDNGAVCMTYGSTASDIVDGTYSYDIASGTEMYYTIDVANLTLDESTGKYLVMIGTNGSENYGTTLALTNIKVAGYTITFAEAAIVTASEENTLDTLSIVQQPFAVLTARLNAVEEEEPEVEQIPVNENLTITTASLKAAKVVSGKVATLTVKAGADAETIVITDADGNVVEATKCTTKVSGDVVTFTFIWVVTGSRGDELTYTIRVYDADGLASVNAETVTVTIK